MLTIGSLFSGVGGLELGLEWAGLGPVAWQCELDLFCRRVLAKHWPNVERFEDVRSVGVATAQPVDLICGGFPCQDVSSAGKGAGLTGERSGLWREFARVIGELQPRFVVVENVSSGASRWLDAVVRDLEELGYECLPVPLSASDVGAPHRRARIFVVAHTQRVGRETLRAEVGQMGNSNSEGKPAGPRDAQVAELCGLAGDPSAWSTVPDLRGMVDGVPNRSHRLRALGNAVVPQCAEVIGWVVRELESQRAVKLEAAQ